MLPPDLASRTQLTANALLKPVTPNQQITDKLADLVPGQRLMAEIQAFLPNGTYRAMIAQRDVTLALPFSAKAGDTLELEVVDTDGQLTLAVIARPQGSGEKPGAEAVSTTLSRTGQLIANLFGNSRERNAETSALPLNRNQPLTSAPPASAQDILPALRQAITQSGMFYEAHQAEWVAGRFDKAALLQEPQGRLSPHLATPPASPDADAAAAGDKALGAKVPETGMPARAAAMEGDTENAARTLAATSSGGPATQLVAREAMPIVQQQLEALANQQFSWQGQIWPGQQMHWEIEEGDREQNGGDEPSASWQTRLLLTLPQLGKLDARIRLNANQIHLDIDAGDEAAQARLRNAIGALQQQLDDAGLTLGTVAISTTRAADEQSGQTTDATANA